jgi:uncharacterized protein
MLRALGRSPRKIQASTTTCTSMVLLIRLDSMTDDDLRDLLLDTKVIAVVGLSANPERASNQVAWYLHHQGYRLFGVNPMCLEPEVFGVPVLASLDQVPEPIDLVDVFRRPKHTPEAARAAVAVGARALWLQLGIRSDEARAIAEQGGLAYVEDACLKVEHARLLGRAARSQGVTGRP